MLEWVLIYLAIGAVWSWGTNGHASEPFSKHDFVLSMATWPVEVGVLLISYAPILYEEIRDKIDEWKVNRKS